MPEAPMEEDEDDGFAEEPEKPFSLSLGDLGAISEALRKMGKAAAARYISNIERIDEDDGAFTFVTSKALAYNSLKNDEKSLEKAIAAAFGEDPAIRLRLEEKESGDSVFSPRMRELKAVFGGSLIRTGKEENKPEEEDAAEHEPVRNAEDNGLYTEPDEDD